jgi:hypothetical protein
MEREDAHVGMIRERIDRLKDAGRTKDSGG